MDEYFQRIAFFEVFAEALAAVLPEITDDREATHSSNPFLSLCASTLCLDHRPVRSFLNSVFHLPLEFIISSLSRTGCSKSTSLLKKQQQQLFYD
jgi:hypothetical protein